MADLDPYALAALGVYLAALVGFSLLGTIRQAARRGGAFARLAEARAQAKEKAKEHAFALLPTREGEDFIIYASGKLAGRAHAHERFRHPLELAPVDRFALVKDMDGQTGLVLTAGGQDLAVTGLEEIARIYHLVQKDGAPLSFVFRADESERMKGLLGKLAPKELEMLRAGMMPNEVITDVIFGVDYEGALKTAGGRGMAPKLVVTNLRVILLAQTIQRQAVAGGTLVTTHFNLVNYPLPLARGITLEALPGLGRRAYRLLLDLPPEMPKAPVLRLTTDHTGILLPIALFSRPLSFVDAGAGIGSVIGASLRAIGWGILTGGAALGAGFALGEGYDSWYERYVPVLAAGGFLTPIVLRTFTAVENRAERARQVRATAAA